MDALTTIISLILAPLTGIASYMAGRRKRDNDFLQQLQNSINLLSKENANLLREVLEVKRENIELKIQVEIIAKEKQFLEKKVANLEKIMNTPTK